MAGAFFRVRFEWIPLLNTLSDAERGALFSEMARYALSGAAPALSGAAADVFAVIRPKLDKDLATASIHRNSGALGGRPKNQTQTKIKPNKNQAETKIEPNENQTAQEPSPLSSPLSPLHPSLPPIIPPQETLSSPPSGGDGETRPGSFKRTPPPLAHDSEAYKAARYLDRRIRDRLPTKPPANEPTLQAWALEIDRLHRIDGQSWDDIADALEFSQDDSFWAPNIMSGAKFRKQFFQLVSKMQKEART